jgi:hypothetical protein
MANPTTDPEPVTRRATVPPPASKPRRATVKVYREGDQLPDGSIVGRARAGELTLRRE